MKIYNYDPYSLVFTGEGEADESPREPGVFLLPAHSTKKAPPADREGYLRVYRNDKWQFVRAPSSEVAEDDPQLTEEDYSNAIQLMLDARAKDRRYDSIFTAISYRDDPNPVFAAEAQAFFDWRSAVWTYAANELAKVKAGEREQPTIAEIISELPALTLPQG